MAYTSEQYKYLLIQRLRRHMAMYNDQDRIYTYNFFGHLFDDSVVITEEAYNRFMELMDDEIQFCADNNIYYDEDITQDMIDAHGLLLTEAFAAIGIDLVIAKDEDGYGGHATFTKPSGEVMIYQVSSQGGFAYTSGINRFRICAQSRTEYNYAKASAWYYNLRDKEVIGLDEYNPFRAGPETFWTYDADLRTMVITGTGTYVAAPQDPQLGGGPYDVLILGANVSRITTGSLKDNNLRAVVFWHAADAEIFLEDSVAGTANVMRTLDIYCDNTTIRNYSQWPAEYNIRWHALSEWDGVSNIPEPERLYYNGHLLPVFKTDAAYVAIGTTASGLYVAIPSGSAKHLAEGKTTLSAGLFSPSWNHTAGTFVWTKVSGLSNKSMTPFWANYDILNADGTVFLKASEPTTTP